MSSHFPSIAIRHAGVALAVAAIALLGCARKLQIEIPADFHGHVQITCAGLNADHSSAMHVDNDGSMKAATCPERASDVVVTRRGDARPVHTSVMWTTTGDGLVREISFDVR